VIAKQHAEKQGCDEALLVTATGEITECASSSFFFVQDGAIVTRPLSNNILPGVTRRSVIAAATDLGLRVEERVAMLSEATEADEAFITGASTYVEPVVAIDGHLVGTGEPGPVTLRVREEYLRQVRSSFYEPY